MTTEEISHGVFISWSGDVSKQVAQVLRKWLPNVSKRISPFMSETDIAPGDAWFESLQNAMNHAARAIVCVTPDNQHGPWLNFEAGAIANRLGNTRVCPFLFRVPLAELEGPLRQYQSTEYREHEHDDKRLRAAIAHLVESLHDELSGEERIQLRSRIDAEWSDLRERLAAVSIFVSPFVQPLHIAERHSLQVLARKFSIGPTPDGSGLHLTVHFDGDAPAIWSSRGKQDHLAASREDVRRTTDLQKSLDGVLSGKPGASFHAEKHGVRFRFASGGTLPMVRYPDGREYYCLNYREIHPIGWNIANGGCDRRDELLDPWSTIKRELVEELIIIDPERNHRYVFYEDMDIPYIDLFAQALGRADLPSFRELELHNPQVELKAGPDSLTVCFGDHEPQHTDRYFLNVNVEDLGIELDQVARIAISDTVVFLGGEFSESTRTGFRMIDAPVGLFEVEQMHADVDGGKLRFEPSLLYWHGERIADPDRIHAILTKGFVHAVEDILSPEALRAFQDAVQEDRYRDLCPVTKTLIRRSCSVSKWIS